MILFYTDQELDKETGLYNYDARLYDPIIGRFISADSIVPKVYDPQALDRYAYCRNNPIIYKDPNGHWFGIDDAFTGPFDEIAVLGFLGIAAYGFGNQAALDALNKLNNKLDDIVDNLIDNNDNNLDDSDLPDSPGDFDLDHMSKSGSELDPADRGGKLTRAGRAIDKHGRGARPENSLFPSPQGSPETRNNIGQEQLDDILTDPDSTATKLGRGGLQVTAPDGRAARFGPDGTFEGFAEDKGIAEAEDGGIAEAEDK